MWAQADLRKVLAATGARVVEGEVAVGHAHQKLAADGTLLDENLREQLTDVIDGLVEAVRLRTAAVAA